MFYDFCVLNYKIVRVSQCSTCINMDPIANNDNQNVIIAQDFNFVQKTLPNDEDTSRQ